jgi:hypothetical protein
MKSGILLIIYLFLSISGIAQARKDSTFKVLKKYYVKKNPFTKTDLIYENETFIIYFDKLLFLNFTNNFLIKHDQKSKERIDDNLKDIQTLLSILSNTYGNFYLLDPSFDTYHYSLPITYQIPEFQTFSTNKYSCILKRDANEKYPQLCKWLIGEYIAKGEFLIFDKRKYQFLRTDFIKLIEISEAKDNEIGGRYESTSQEYRLPNNSTFFTKFISYTLKCSFPNINYSIQK